ncbi:O-antigen ligase domain-containing protein [Vibrio ponticus]|uniref:O-antigen ligase domain-containing protein n=2 Tax=Vibrio ponticus TaxID=265668 RepID=A0A3N3DXH4_9VIBR|nr:O-antigen ligase domain-containing protein [Vibrio ponticus]
MAIAGSLVALSALIIGETRGNILALAVALSVLFLVVGIKNKAFIYSCLIAILLVSAVSFHQIQQRYVETKQEILNTAHGKFNNSIGNRIQMWKAGIEISKDPTIFGLGNHHIEVKEKLYKQGKIPKNTVRYKHYHNQYLTAFITKGITGLLALILILGYPVYSYLKNRNNYNLIAILCSTIYAIAGLTDIPLSQPHSLIFYLVILLLLCNSDERNANSV